MIKESPEIKQRKKRKWIEAPEIPSKSLKDQNPIVIEDEDTE
jgi:hypothetical protein